MALIELCSTRSWALLLLRSSQQNVMLIQLQILVAWIVVCSGNCAAAAVARLEPDASSSGDKELVAGSFGSSFTDTSSNDVGEGSDLSPLIDDASTSSGFQLIDEETINLADIFGVIENDQSVKPYEEFEPPTTDAPLQGRLILPVPGGDSAEVIETQISLTSVDKSMPGPTIGPITRASVGELIMTSPPIAFYAPRSSSTSGSGSKASRATSGGEAEAGIDNFHEHIERRRHLRG